MALEDEENDMKYRENIQQSLGTETSIRCGDMKAHGKAGENGGQDSMTGKLVSPSKKGSRGSKEREKTPLRRSEKG